MVEFVEPGEGQAPRPLPKPPTGYSTPGYSRPTVKVTIDYIIIDSIILYFFQNMKNYLYNNVNIYICWRKWYTDSCITQ